MKFFRRSSEDQKTIRDWENQRRRCAALAAAAAVHAESKSFTHEIRRLDNVRVIGQTISQRCMNDPDFAKASLDSSLTSIQTQPSHVRTFSASEEAGAHKTADAS